MHDESACSLPDSRAFLVVAFDGMNHWFSGPDARIARHLFGEHVYLPEASTMELRAVKLSFPMDPVGPSLMTHNRALHNPPIAVPSSGLPSHQNASIKSDFLLVCDAYSRTLTDGRWRFTLEAADGEMILEAEDHEFGDLNRLTLLAAVRGLESIEGASAVTLLSNNRYVIRSLSKSLPRWRQNDFRWEHFGRRIEVQHGDLWRRIDRTLAIHRVQACLVSSCLVSHGQSSRAPSARHTSTPMPFDSRPALPNESATESTHLRIDPAHHASQTSIRSVVPAPSERLRRLINGETNPRKPAGEAVRRRGRFTAQDLDS